MKRLISAFQNSAASFRHLVRHEAAFKQECALLVASIPLAYIIAPNLAQFFILLFVILLIIIVEVLNTGIEAVCDAVSPEFDANIKIAKDCGSLAVLIAILIAAVTWLLAASNWLFS